MSRISFKCTSWMRRHPKKFKSCRCSRRPHCVGFDFYLLYWGLVKSIYYLILVDFWLKNGAKFTPQSIQHRCRHRKALFWKNFVFPWEKQYVVGERGAHRILCARPDPLAGGGRGRVEQIEGGLGAPKWRSGGATIEVRRVWDVFWAVMGVWINLWCFSGGSLGRLVAKKWPTWAQLVS